MFLQNRENDTPFGKLRSGEKYSFGYDLLRLFHAKNNQTVELSHAEDIWWRMYRLNKYFGIKPFEIDLVPIEDQNAMLTMHDYDIDARNKREEER